MTCAIESCVATENRDDPQPSAAADPKGPPTLYTAALADWILCEIENGRSLHDVCQDDGVPAYSTVHGWIGRDHHGFAARYASARDVGYAKRRRATVYSEAIAQRLLDELARGRPLGDVCQDDGMPAASTVKLWVSTDRDGFASRYAQAREIGGPTGGNPTLYTPGIAEYLLEELADGRTLSDVCRDQGMPSRATVRHWVKEDREGFAARYREAREFGFHAMGDAMLDIADDSRGDVIRRRRKDGTIETVANPVNLNRARLRIEVRSRLLSSALPKTNGVSLSLIAEPQPRDMVAELMKVINDTPPWGLPSQHRAQAR